MKQKIYSYLKKYNLLFLILSGAGFSFCFAPYYLIFLVPLFLYFLFWNINQDISGKSIFFRSFLFGFGFGAVSTGWIAKAILLDESLYWVVPFAWLGMGVFFGLFYGISAYCTSFYKVGYKRLFAFASFFTLFEWIRSWFLTGFPWNLTGSVWENTLPVLQLASVFGVYGLTFLTITTTSVLAFLPNKRPLIFSIFILGIIFTLGSLRLYSAPSESVWGVQLRIVQPNIPQDLKWDPKESENSFVKLLKLSRHNSEKITHTIWPESSVSFLVNHNDSEKLRLMQAVSQGGTLILGGMRALPQERTVANSLFVLDDLANIQSYYDKSHLVPFGEYVPLRGILPFDKIVPIPYDLFSGNGPKTIATGKTPPFGALVCYEVIFSGQVVNQKRRPQWLINVTNDGWYGISSGPYQHLGMAQMRAVEEGLPLVRSANTGISAIFDGYGKIIGKIPLNTEGVLDVSLPTALPPTIYSQFGVWLPLGFCLLILIFLTFKRK